MSELLKKYESLDQSKLNEGTIKILNRVKTITADFTADDAKNNKIAEDVLNEVMKKNPDAVKIVKRTPKAKTAPKKTHKATHTTKATHTSTSTAKTSNNIMSVTKEIQKAGESWKDAMERAKAVIKERKEKVVQKQKTELEKLYNLVKTKKELQGFANSDIRRDSVRDAKPRGARVVTKQGTTSNKYGTFPNKLGRKYWETRDRHADRLAPNYPKDMPLLASGGAIENIAITYGKMLNDLSKEKQFNKKTEKNAMVNRYAKENDITIDNNNIIYIKGQKIAFIDKINQKTGQFKTNWDIKKFADGGYTQGYDDREDERLGMKYGKIANKDLDSTHSRRDDARFEERGKMANGGSVNMDKHVWEGWTVGDFIEELEPTFNQIMSGRSWQKPFKTKDEVKAWTMDNQPYYKKNIPEVVNYFWAKAQSKDNYADGGSITQTMIVNMPDGSDIKVETKLGILSKISKRVSLEESKNSVLFYKLPADLQQKINKRLNPNALADGGTMWTKEMVENEIAHYKNLLRNIDKYPNYNKKNVEKIIAEYEEKLAKNEFAYGGMTDLTIQNVSFAKGGSVDIVKGATKVGVFSKEDLKTGVFEKALAKKSEETGLTNIDLKTIAKGDKTLIELYLIPNKSDNDVKIKDWYLENYPTDDLGEELNDEVTFEDMWNEDYGKYNIYQVMGVGDSVIRERLFEHLAEIKGVSYDVVYRKLFSSDGFYADGGSVSNVIRMYNFLKEDLVQLEEAIKSRDMEEVNRFFSYWLGSSGHLKSLQTMNNQRMYMFLQEDLNRLMLAVENDDTEEVERFFSYWLGSSGHLVSIISSDIVPLVQSETAKIWEKNNPTLTAGVPPENFEKNWRKTQDEAIEKLKNEGKLPQDLKFEDIGFMTKNFEKGGIFYKEGSNKYGLGNTEIFVQEENDMYCVYDNVYNDETENWEIKKLADFDTMDEAKEFAIEHSKKEYANGGSLPFMTDPNFGNFQNTGAFANGGSIGDLTEQEFLKKYFGVSVFTENPSQYFEIKKLSSSDDAKVNAFVKELKADGFTVKKRAFSDFTSVMGVKKKASFELGGAFMTTDLAGHTGGSFGTGNQTPLSGVSGTYYTGLVGETGAMSSGELFMDGGVMAQNQQVINDASQSYVNYYLGEGAGQGIYKDGGSIPNNYEGRTPEDVWNNLSRPQRSHFLYDHIFEIEAYKNIERLPSSEIIKAYNSEWSSLDKDIKNRFTNHTREGQYAKGGSLKNAKELSEEDRFELKVLQSIRGYNQGVSVGTIMSNLGFQELNFNVYPSVEQHNKVDKSLKSLVKKGFIDAELSSRRLVSMMDFVQITQKGADYLREFDYGSYASGGSLGEELMGGQSNSTLKPSGYHLVSAKGREIIVSDDGGNSKERWVKNNGFSGYRLVYKGNDYEFTDSFEGGGFTPDVSDGTQFMSGVYAYGGKTKSRPSMREFYIEQIAFSTNTRKEGVDAFAKEHNLTESELSNLMTGLGRKMISQSDFVTALVGNKNNPKQKEVVAFAKSDKAYKMADGGFTPDVSDGTQFMSGVYANGGGIRSKEELKKIFSEKEAIVKNLTPKQIAEMWNENSFAVKEGISKPITIEEAKRPSMKIYLENLLIENELTEEEQAKYFADGGNIAKGFVKAYYNDSISGGDNGHQVDIMFYENSDDDDYYDEEFVTTDSPEEAENLADKINNEGYEGFLPKNSYADGGFMNDVYSDGGAINGQLNKKIQKLAEKKGFTIEKSGKDLYNKSMTQALVESLTDANFHDEAKEVVVKAEGKTKWSDDLYESVYFNPTLPIITDFAREVARLCEWGGDDILNAYYFITKMQGSKVATMIDDLFFNKKSKSVSSPKKGSREYTYVPNKDIEELSVVIDSKSKELKGSDILDGVYVKNSAKSNPSVKATSKIDETKAHFQADALGNVFVDSNFINQSKGNLPNSELKHYGFGEFYLETPDGNIEFIRTDEEKEGFVGRTHKMKGSDELVLKLVNAMKEKGKFESNQTFADGGFMNDVYANGGGVAFKPYGKTKGKFKITYIDGGEKVSEIRETLEMAIDTANRYKKYDEFSKIEVFDESGKKIMADGGFMNDVYAKGGATKTFEYVPYKFIYRELDDEDAEQVIFTPEEAEEFIQDWNRDMETDYKDWQDFNKGEEYRELEAIMIKQRKFADGGFMNDVYADGGDLEDYDDVFVKIYNKYNSKDYWGLKDRISNTLSSWESAIERGDENAKKYKKEDIVEIIKENNMVDSYNGTYLPLKNAIKNSDKKYLKSRIRYDQKFTKELYEAITGNKLPNTNKEIQVYFDSNYADGGFMNDVYAKGGELQGKFLAEIKVPYNYEKVVKDEFEFTEFLSKALTKKWFGNGVWGVKIVKSLFGENYGQKIVVEIEIPVGVTQGGGLDKFDVGEFISKTLTKKWFGNGIWGVDIISSYADGGDMKNVGIQITKYFDRKKGKWIMLNDYVKTIPYSIYTDEASFTSGITGILERDGYPVLASEWKFQVVEPQYADGGIFEDNEGFMSADNNFNYRYPEMEVYVETFDEPIDLTSNVSTKTNQVVIKPLEENIDLSDDKRVRATMGYTPKNRNPESFAKINPRAFEFIEELPMPTSHTHKND